MRYPLSSAGKLDPKIRVLNVMTKLGAFVLSVYDRPATAPGPRQENVRREFSLDIDGIEGDDQHNDVSVPQLENNDALEELISAPVHKPYTK